MSATAGRPQSTSPSQPMASAPPPPTVPTPLAPPVNYGHYAYTHWPVPPAKHPKAESQGVTVARTAAAITGGIAGAALLLAILLMMAAMYGGPGCLNGVGLVIGVLGYIPLSVFCAAVLPFVLPKRWWRHGFVGSALLLDGFSGLLILLGHYA